MDGSARIVLQLEQSFSQYVFIEKDGERVSQLEALKRDFNDRNITILQGDANHHIQTLCDQWCTSQRGVLFLDPFGLQVEWRTIVAIAGTQRIDLWFLLLLSDINRSIGRVQGDKAGEPMKQQQEEVLTNFFGTDEWKTHLIQPSSQTELLGVNPPDEKVSSEKIVAYVRQQLEKEFKGVAPNPQILRDDQNHPLFALFFAAGNKKGAPIAIRIAKHLLEHILNHDPKQLD